ncbi:unnamed protein product [Victoria cruziana]
MAESKVGAVGSFYGRRGHLEDEYWNKHGLPPNYASSSSLTLSFNKPTVKTVETVTDGLISSETVTMSMAEYEQLLAHKGASYTTTASAVTTGTTFTACNLNGVQQ